MGILDPLPQWRSHRSRRCQKVLVFKCNYAGLRWTIYATAKGQYFFFWTGQLHTGFAYDVDLRFQFAELSAFSLTTDSRQFLAAISRLLMFFYDPSFQHCCHKNYGRTGEY